MYRRPLHVHVHLHLHRTLLSYQPFSGPGIDKDSSANGNVQSLSSLVIFMYKPCCQTRSEAHHEISHQSGTCSHLTPELHAEVRSSDPNKSLSPSRIERSRTLAVPQRLIPPLQRCMRCGAVAEVHLISAGRRRSPSRNRTHCHLCHRRL